MPERVVEEIGLDRAWTMLVDDPDAVLVDVRTKPEWLYVGKPHLEAIAKRPVFVSWAHYPAIHNGQFVDEIRASGVRYHQPLLLLCRSGVRSRAAAEALLAAGFERCLNVTDGFEGDIDDAGHRTGGWRGHGLPWRQT